MKLPLILLALVALLLLVTACGPSEAEKLNKEGNESFAQQAFQEALVAYQSAQIEEPELAEPYYNAANALYRQGAYEAALEQMHMALSFADEESLAQAGYYNLGNTSFNQQDLGTAVAAYTEALLLNPDDQDAKYNLELALQQQQNEEQQEEQEQEEQESEEGQQEEEEQQDQGEEEQEQQEGQGEQEEQESESQEGEQSDEQQEGQESEEEQEQQGQQGEEEQEEQQQGQGQPQEGQPDEEQQGQLNQLPQPGQRMTEEQAEQLLAAIARDGQTLQEKLGQIFAVPWSPPVQDW